MISRIYFMKVNKVYMVIMLGMLMYLYISDIIVHTYIITHATSQTNAHPDSLPRMCYRV